MSVYCTHANVVNTIKTLTIHFFIIIQYSKPLVKVSVTFICDDVTSIITVDKETTHTSVYNIKKNKILARLLWCIEYFNECKNYGGGAGSAHLYNHNIIDRLHISQALG